MQYVGIIFCILMSLFGYKKEKNLYNPLTIFFFIFGLILFLSSLNLYGLYETSQYTYIIILIGLFSFFIGYCFVYIMKPKNTGIINPAVLNLNNFYKYQIKYKLIYVIYLITILFLAYRALLLLDALFSGHSLTEIRSNQAEILIVPDWYSVISQYVIGPLVFVLLPIGIIDLFRGKRKLIIPTVIVVIFEALGDGGRFIFFYFIIECIIAATIFKKYSFLSRKLKRRILIFTSLSVVFLLIISNLRVGDSSLFQSMYLYIAGSIPHLDYRLGIVEDNQSFTYGLTFFSGYLTPALFILNALGILKYPDFYNNSIEIVKSLNDFVNIGDGNLFNAFVTPFYYFYLDLGIAGIVIFSIIYGFIFTLSYHYAKNRPNILNISIYLLFMQGAFTSMVRWQFFVPAYALAFIYLVLVVRRNGKKT